MRVDDFIVLGRTTPAISKKYGPCVCMAGYSEELNKFMRIYPTNIKSKAKTLCKISADVERRSGDNRLESWALKDRTESSILSISKPIDKNDILPILDNNVAESTEELNSKKLSLGILKPESFEVILEKRTDPEICNNGIRTMESFPYNPRLVLPPKNKQQSKFKLYEWGIYELMRSYEKKGKTLTAEDIKNALYISEKKAVYFLIGNLVGIRNVWLVIKVFTFPKKG